MFAIDDYTISARALDPDPAPSQALALTQGARLELRTFSCDRGVLGLGSDVVRYGAGRVTSGCHLEGVPCGLQRFRWAPEQGDWLDASLDANLPWPGGRPDPDPALTAYGPVELPVLRPGGTLQELWVSAPERGPFLVAFKLIADGRVVGGQLGRYRFHGDTDPPWLELEATTLTSTAWIGGRHLPDGRVALISDTGLSALLDPDTWEFTPGPSFARDGAICEPRPGAPPERSLRGAVEVWNPGDGGPVVVWAGTSCGAVLRRRLDAPEWQRLDPGDLRGTRVHLHAYGPDRAFVVGTARNAILSVVGDRSSLEPLFDDVMDVTYVGPGPDGSILAAGRLPPLGATGIYRREGSTWVLFLEVTLGARAFRPIDDGLLVLTTLVSRPVLSRTPGRPYGEEDAPVDLRGALAFDLRPIAPRIFGAITYGPEGRPGLAGAAVLVTAPLVRCDLATE